MKTITKTPIFWALFSATTIAAIFVSYRYFPRAFPIIHLNISMDRSQAVTQAHQLAQQFHLGPTDSRTATAFVTDDTVKTFVELEAGGKEAVTAMMRQNLYQIYTWQVRQFKPFEQREVTILFTPEGSPYGFHETLSENDPETNVSESKAQEIALQFAKQAPWNVDVKLYKIVEVSHEKKASGRINHTIMYERTNEKIGEGFYRLKIVVSGDHVSELTHSVKVPDAFIRRYQEMRSSNETVASIAKLFVLLLYMLGCLLIGLIYLFRHRLVIWKPAFMWGSSIALLTSAVTINKLPLLWMGYNSALSPYAFLAQLLVQLLFGFLLSMLSLTAIFMGAEGLTRRAFGNQLQLWHIFNPEAASSYTVLGYTISAYLLVSISLAYGVIFYLLTAHYLHWWIPSSNLFDPNILASYLPWFESISLSLSAGFSEECLFRAIPLASAALLGTRYGKRNWWIAGVFIIQALIFGAAHANYPAQPAYARLVELIAFSSLMGGIYLKFGLLISIITHFVYDVFWFALPLFLSTAWISKGILIALAGIPLWIVGISRIKMGAWLPIPPSLYNRAWQPVAKKEQSVAIEQPAEEKTHTVSKQRMHRMLIVGIIGLCSWALTTRFSADTPTFSTKRAQITEQAKKTLQEKQINLETWYPIVYTINQMEQQPHLLKQHRFIWQQGGKDLYRKFLTSYLTSPMWVAHFVTWHGNVTDRSEEHNLFIMPDGSTRRYEHKLPEAAPGASLSKEDAQHKAVNVIKEQFGYPEEQLKEVSAISTKQPNRLDWKVTYAGTTDYPLDEGEARLEVLIAGDEVVDAYQYIHVPEQWERTYINQLTIANVINSLCMLVLFLLMLICSFFILSRWKIQVTSGLITNVILLTGILIFTLFNQWPSFLSIVNTSQPLHEQLFRNLWVPIVMAIIQAAAFAFMISLFTQARSQYRALPASMGVALGISWGLLIAGIIALIQWFIPSLSPTWANYTPLGNLFPSIASVSNSLILYLTTTISVGLFVLITDRITDYWKQRHTAGILIFFIVGFAYTGLTNSYNIPLFLTTGSLLTILFLIAYITVIRFDHSIIPLMTATYLILQITQQLIFNAYPYALIANSISILLIAGIAWFWYQQMKQQYDSI